MQRTIFTAAARSARSAATRTAPSGVRFSSQLPIPPKVATPNMVSSGGSSKRMEGVVAFYKSLPKGAAPKPRGGGGIKARFFDGANASPKPIVATIAALLLIGYTIDYNMHLKHHKNNHH